MERGFPSLTGTLRFQAVCAFLGALAVCSAMSKTGGGGTGSGAWAPVAALLYTLVAWIVTSTAVRRAAIAIEASEGGLEPWLRLLAVASVVGYGAIAAFALFAAQARHSFPDDNPTLGIIALVGILFVFGGLPEAAARSLAADEEQRALRGLLGGRTSGVKTTATQGRRIGRGGASASSPPSSPPPPGPVKGKKAAPTRPRWFGKKPVAPSPLDSILGDRDFLP